ncbi:hypothetical protein QWJ34_03470 [Saccharibacillus sp. CPCC 101409]|uniref:hypothetical protein n=1 Tax=Saccharibacillus sp. CPCC 101409 TaxID=3058041 RepID=UPI002673BA83|nr:hypothetical protein [Saccharibacillus sp. CPCC 101409]MDO3408817.1 hypothetical protein [Saccharibacillus sp. CPCC 101409]
MMKIVYDETSLKEAALREELRKPVKVKAGFAENRVLYGERDLIHSFDSGKCFKMKL